MAAKLSFQQLSTRHFLLHFVMVPWFGLSNGFAHCNTHRHTHTQLHQHTPTQARAHTHTHTYANFTRRLKITSTSTERQKRSQNLAPVLVIVSGNFQVSSRKIITSTGYYRCCAPGASAPVVVKDQCLIYSKNTPVFCIWYFSVMYAIHLWGRTLHPSCNLGTKMAQTH